MPVDDGAALLADPVQLLAVAGVVVCGGEHTAVAEKSEASGEAKETSANLLVCLRMRGGKSYSLYANIRNDLPILPRETKR